MDERFPRLRTTLRTEWIRHDDRVPAPREAAARAGVAGAYLPPLRLELPHRQQERLGDSVPLCVSIVLEYWCRQASTVQPAWARPDWLSMLLRTDAAEGTPGLRLEWLRGWGVRVEYPRHLQFFRDGTRELEQRLSPNSGMRLLYRWEDPWLRYIGEALAEGVPPILFVDLGRLHRQWRGLCQPHAVVLVGGHGRQAWIHDPAHSVAPLRVGLSTLLDSLLPGEPLAALLRPDWAYQAVPSDQDGADNVG